MELRHVYCVPEWAESSPQTVSTIDLLTKVELSMKIRFQKRVFDDDADHKEKLIGLSVRYGLKLPQTARTKELRYPHLILFDEDGPVIFYPQMRKGGNGRIEISIKNYLENLLKGQVSSLVEVPALKKYHLEKFSILREGYLEMARETKSLNETWKSADTEWPE